MTQLHSPPRLLVLPLLMLLSCGEPEPSNPRDAGAPLGTGGSDGTANTDATAGTDATDAPDVAEGSEVTDAGTDATGQPDATEATEPEPCPDGTEEFVDGNGEPQCCGGETPQWCPPSGEGFAGACQVAGTDCTTLKQCGKGWHACPSGLTSHCSGDGETVCCGGASPTWCPPDGATLGICAQAAADCGQTLDCGEGFAACDVGQEAHCTSDAKLACCGGEAATWCGPGDGIDASFPGQCFATGSVCDTVSPGHAGAWIACTSDEVAGWDAEGKLVCCGPELPVLCEAYDGLDSSFDGSVCLPEGTLCGSLTKNAEGTGWDWCSGDANYGLAADSTLLCCAGDTPKLCAGGITVFDGDTAYQSSLAEVLPPATCADQCTANSDCNGDIPLKCKEPTNEFCNQCVASPKAYPIPYPGGCWPAEQDCGRIYKCADAFVGCAYESCYCWNEQKFSIW